MVADHKCDCMVIQSYLNLKLIKPKKGKTKNDKSCRIILNIAWTNLCHFQSFAFVTSYDLDIVDVDDDWHTNVVDAFDVIDVMMLMMRLDVVNSKPIFVSLATHYLCLYSLMI